MIILLVLLSIYSIALCAESTSCVSSGLKSSDTQICTGTSCRLCSVEVITDGTNNATCAVYNGTTSSGIKIFNGGPIIGSALFGGVVYEVPIRSSAGIFLDLTGTGAKAIVTYDLGQ